MSAASSEAVATTQLNLDTKQFEAGLALVSSLMEKWADKVKKQMGAAAQETEQKTKEAQTTMTEQFGKLVSKVDKYTSVVGLNLASAFASVGVSGGKALVDLANRTDMLNKALERSAELAERLAAATERRYADLAERLDAVSADPAARLAELNAQIEAATKESIGIEGEAKGARRKRELEGFWNQKEIGPDKTRGDVFYDQWSMAGMWATGGLEEHQKHFDDSVKEVEARLKAHADRLRDLEKERTRLLDPDKDDRKNKIIDQMTHAIEEQTKSLGLQGEELEILKLQWQGFGEMQIRKIRVAMAERDLMTKAMATASFAGGFGLVQTGTERKEIEDVTKALERQAATWGLNADAVQLFELRMKGASAEQLRMVEQAQREKDILIAAKAGILFAGGFNLMQSKGPDAQMDGSKMSSALIGGSSGAANAIAAARQSTRIASQNDPQTKAARELEALNRKTDESIRVLGGLDGTMRGVREALEAIGVA